MDVGRVVVVGLGYIGLPTAAALATRGVQVVGIDVRSDVIDAVNAGLVPFVEPDLGVAVSGAVAQGNLSAQQTVPDGDVFLIAVPTPLNPDRSPDLGHVRNAVDAIAPALRPGNVVILESTCPPGTTRQVSEWLERARPDLALPHAHENEPDIHVAHCPERVLPGRVMIELVTNDRVVGGLSQECARRAEALYRIFCQGEIALVSAESAELTKLVENSYRDVNIAFANEVAAICESRGVDPWEVIRAANRHPRVNILNPGPGVGGHCIAVDPWFLVASSPTGTELVQAARRINDSKPALVAEAAATVAQSHGASVIGCLGLTFKADVDDVRESPAVQVVAELASLRSASSLLVAEPHVPALPPPLDQLPNVELKRTESVIAESHLLVALVGHTSFAQLGKRQLGDKATYDACGLWT